MAREHAIALLRCLVSITAMSTFAPAHAQTPTGLPAETTGGTPTVSDPNVLVVKKQPKVIQPPKPMNNLTLRAKQETVPPAPKAVAQIAGRLPSPISPAEQSSERAADGVHRAAAKTVALDLPLKFQSFYLGDVAVRLPPDGKVYINASTLAEPLKKIMKPEAVSAVISGRAANLGGGLSNDLGGDGISAASKSEPPDRHSSGTLIATVFGSAGAAQSSARKAEERAAGPASEQDDFISIEDLRQRGLVLRYDPLQSELTVVPAIDQKRDGNIDFGSSAAPVVSANASTPAYASAYLNTRMVTGYVSQSIVSQTGYLAPSFDFDGALRVGSIVLENEMTLTPSGPSGTGYGLTRSGSRIIYDRPDEIVRFKAGDLTPAFTGFQTSPDILGVSVERSYAQLRPGESIRPTGHHSFRLERAAHVDILADGVVIRRLYLQPGNYNLNDLPISPGANKITLLIEDDTGERRTLEFSQFGGPDLLAPGIGEWVVAAGVQSSRGALPASGMPPAAFAYRDPDYFWTLPIATGFYRLGLTPSLTGGINAQASSNAVMGGGSLSAQTPYGYVSADLSSSWSGLGGVGAAGRLAYELVNVRDGDGKSQSFRLTAEHQSAAFSSAALPPTRASETSVSASYTRELTEDLSLSVSGTVYGGADVFSITKWDSDVTISDRFSPSLSGALSLSYGEGGSATASSASVTPCGCAAAVAQTGLRALARLIYRPGPSSLATLSFDNAERMGRATFSQNETSGGSSWNVLADTSYDGKSKSGDLNASAGYSGNRGSIAVTHLSQVDDLGPGVQPRSTDERTTLRIETGVATADGAWTFGRPVTNSFAIVGPHDTIADRDVSLGPHDRENSHSDWFAPALVSDIAPYVQRRVEFDVANLPVGYDLGAGAFDFYAPYKAGYRVTAGSAYTVTATGKLIARDGRPLSLLAGKAREDDKNNRRVVELFTNKNGKFGAQGLSPGQWTIEMATEPQPTRYRLLVTAGVSGLYDAGELRPEKD